MRIGVDFDNTIAGYDHAFAAAAREAGLLPPDFAGDRNEVRDRVRSLPGGETEWMRLQGRVYGARMGDAEPLPGAESFLGDCCARGVELYIVSHKTRHGHFDAERVDLRDAALRWMEARGFFDPARIGLPRNHVYFENTREAKLARIRALGCSHFIDDLEEVFREPGFPREVDAILLAPGRAAAAGAAPFRVCRSWSEVSRAVLAR